MKPRVIIMLLLIISLLQNAPFSFANTEQATPKKIVWEDQVFYQVYPRSFYDSNNDGIGDLNGIRAKLDYLQNLGVTALWLNVIFASDTAHNYFADDFYQIDPEYGTMEEFANLVEDVHRRGMIILLDMETQYITASHQWFRDSFQNPSSKYGKFIKYNGPGNTDPESIAFGFTHIATYDKQQIPVMTLNLANPEVVSYQKDLYSYWLDPNKDGNFSDGLDGYRLDHVMDNLDNKGQYTGLCKNFWQPIIRQAQKTHPQAFFLAEPGDWASYGDDLMEKAGIDGAFNIPLCFAISSLDKNKILSAIANSEKSLKPGKYRFTIIENHDLNHRFASVTGGDLALQKIGAVLNLTLGGVPNIYYGQEIGMQGIKGSWPNDGADIPLREAFEWYKTKSGPGMALWYKGTGPWWDKTFLKDNDGVSYEEQKDQPDSLWQTYRKLIALRKKEVALRKGDIQEIDTKNNSVLAYLRQYKVGGTIQNVAVIINLSNKPQTAKLNLGLNGIEKMGQAVQNLLNEEKLPPLTELKTRDYEIKLAAYQSYIIKIGA